MYIMIDSLILKIFDPCTQWVQQRAGWDYCQQSKLIALLSTINVILAGSASGGLWYSQIVLTYCLGRMVILLMGDEAYLRQTDSVNPNRSSALCAGVRLTVVASASIVWFCADGFWVWTTLSVALLMYTMSCQPLVFSRNNRLIEA